MQIIQGHNICLRLYTQNYNSYKGHYSYKWYNCHNCHQDHNITKVKIYISPIKAIKFIVAISSQSDY